MPSPFPGMDPWLESNAVWPDFHDRLAEQISATLNLVLPAPYYAQLGVREEMGIMGQTAARRIVPDVSVNQASLNRLATIDPKSGGVAVLDEPRSQVSESLEIDLKNEHQSVNFVEVRDSRSGHEVITLIEILSPTNKIAGPDHDNYVRKRNEILSSTTSLIEIDLLQAGRRDFFGAEVHQRMYEFSPPLDYIVVVQRAWQRAGSMVYQLFPIRLPDSLPVVAVPLRKGESEAALDLQYTFQQTYDRGPYRRGAVDYTVPPESLTETAATWARHYLDMKFKKGIN